MPTKTVPMPAAELTRRGMAITGQSEGLWRRDLAALTGITTRTLERYQKDQEVPLAFAHALNWLELKPLIDNLKPIIDQIVASRRNG